MTPGKCSPRRRRSIFALAAISSCVSGVDSAIAQTGGTYTFNGNSNWSNSSVWFDGNIPDGMDGFAGFGLGVNLLDTLTVTLDTPRTVGALSFGDSELATTPAGWRVQATGGSVLTLQVTPGATATPGLRRGEFLGPGLNVNTLGTGDGTSTFGTLFQKIANLNLPISGSQGFVKTGAGTAVLSGNNSGLSGTILLLGGVVVANNANALGGVSLLTQQLGQVSFRGDAPLSFSGMAISLQNDSTFGTGNAISSGGVYGSGSNLVHTIGDVTIDQAGVRTLGISGSNGYGLTIGRLNLREGINLINQGNAGSINGGDNNNVNGQGSGLLTVGTIAYNNLTPNVPLGTINFGGVGSYAGNITITNGITVGTLSSGTASLVYSGDRTLTLGGSIGTGGDTYITGGTTGNVGSGNFQAGVGTVIINSGTLPSNRSLALNGTLILNGGALTHNISGLTMGGATLTTAVVPAYLNAGSGTIAIGSGGIVVNDSTMLDVVGTTAGVLSTATAGGLLGRLDLGASTRNIAVNGSSTLTLDGVVSGSGGITKTGTGALNFTKANTFTGNINLVDGVVSGVVQGAGNSFGATPANVSLGGALRLNGTTSAGTGTVNTLTSKDSGINEGLIVDATNGGTTTLNINILGPREANTHGTIKVTPFTGQLNTKEVINISTGAPASTNGMLPAYIAIQNSNADTKLGFASLSSNKIVNFAGYTSGGINGAAITSVYDLAAGSTEALSGAKQLFGLRVGAGASISGAQALSLGNGAAGFGGLILNGGASMNNGTLSGQGADELEIWSGGTSANTIAAALNLGGDVTTGGATALNLTGSVNFGGLTRNISVTGATVTLSNSTALSNGNFVKRGGGVLAVAGDNSLYSGTIGIEGGTLQVGGAGGISGGLGSGAIVDNANITFNKADPAGSFGNAISGSGNLWVNATSAGVVTLGGALSYTGNTTVQNGTLRGPNVADNSFPIATSLRVEGGATFDMNGRNQTLNSIAGTGTITNSNASGGARTLTITGGGTFLGALRNSATGSISLTKNGSDILVLGGANNQSGTMTINGGTLQINTAASAGTGTLVLNNAALAINTNGNLANASLINVGNTTISLMAAPNVLVNALGTFNGNTFANLLGMGPGLVSGAGATNTWTGGGTINLLLNGRTLYIGNNGGGANSAILNTFTGTLKFDDNNSLGSSVHWGLAGPNFTAGSTVATFAFGNGNLWMTHTNGSAQFNLGFVSGGTNTTLTGNQNGVGRPFSYNFGFLPGDQTFSGRIEDYITNGGNSPVGVAKFGASSTVTLKNTLTFSGGMTANAGTLFLGAGANVTNAASIIMNGGTLSILPGGTISSNRTFATSNANVGGGINLASYPGFSTPLGVNFIGGGTIYGNLNHNAGSINPGAVSGFGTLTFNDSLQIQGGAMDFDVSAGTPNVVGGGIHDLLKVNASGGLTLTSGTLRLNFFNGPNSPSGTTPPPALAPGQFYPIIAFNGTFNGALSSVFTTGKFRGSFNLEQGTGSLASTLGAKFVAFGTTTNSLVWQPVSAQSNVWDAAVGFQNYRPLGGSGSLFFFNGDSVTFDDTAPITSGGYRIVQITPGLAPSSVTVNTSGNYIFSGQGFGSIIGSGSLVKNGPGTLFMSGDNSFTGGITVNGGTLVTADPNVPLLVPNALGGPNATTTFNNDSNFRFTSPSSNVFSGPGGTNQQGGNFVFNPGTHVITIPGSNVAHPWNINMFGTGTVVWNRPLDINTSTVVTQPSSWTSFFGTLKISNTLPLIGTSDGTILRPNGGGNPSLTLDLGVAPNGSGLALNATGQTFIIGALRGGPNSSLKLGANNQTGTFIVGHNTISSTFDGVFKATTALQNSVLSPNSIVNVIKNGSGSTLTLTAGQPYLGVTIVNAGTLALANSSSNPLASPLISVGTAGVLDITNLNGGGGLVLNADQRLISNGNVVGGPIEAVSTSTIGGTQFGNPLIADGGATISPGNSVGTLTVSSLTLQGPVNFLVEVDGSGIDSLVLSGTQTSTIITAQSSLNLVNLGGFVPGTYTFLDYTGDPNDQFGIEFGFVPTDFAYGVKVIHDTANTRVLLQFTDTSAQWFANANGTWSTATNWTLDGTNASPTVPNSVRFGTFITAPRTVNVNGTIGNTANSIIFNSPQKYTIAGPGTLTLDSGLGAAPLNVQGGSHAITATVRALRQVSMNIDAGLNLSFGGTVINANNAGITKLGAGSATFTRLNMPGATLTVSAGSVNMSAKAVNNNVDGTNLLGNMTIAAGAKVDLANNAMILDYNTLGSIMTDLRAELANGRLFSSTATANQTVAYRNNNTGTTPAGVATTPGLGLGTVATFAGVASDATSVLIRVTYKGDSNLDGVVNVLDLYNMSLNWLSTSAVWAGGDFNFDGIVNSADLGILAQNWQQGNNNPLPGDDIGAALTAAGIPLSAVPEPGTLALAGVAAAGLLSRRRRRM